MDIPPLRRLHQRDILGYEELMLRADDEIGRARRYQRPFSVMLLELESMGEQGTIGSMVRRMLRRWDSLGVATLEPPALAALLIETGPRGPEGLSHRIKDVMPLLRTGWASFPEDGVTWEALLRSAHERMMRGDTLPVERAG